METEETKETKETTMATTTTKTTTTDKVKELTNQLFGQYPELLKPKKDTKDHNKFVIAVGLSFGVFLDHKQKVKDPEEESELMYDVCNYDYLWRPDGKHSVGCNYYQWIRAPSSQRDPVDVMMAYLFQGVDYHDGEEVGFADDRVEQVTKNRQEFLKVIKKHFADPNEYLRFVATMLHEPSIDWFVETWLEDVESFWNNREKDKDKE